VTTDSVEHGDDKHNSDQAPDPAFVTIALDAMSGEIILVGDEAVLSPLLGKASPERLSVHHASEVVTMEETAAVAMRSKKDSSMRVAINLAEQLYQFAVMGSALAAAVGSKPAPRVGLLNIGSEDIKGNIQVRETDKLLQQANLNYIGFVSSPGRR